MFSILVSTYNRSGVLKRCLNSILAQTFTQYEVLILDDCSNDDTSEIVKEYTKDSRFKYIRFEKNHSQGVILMNFIVKNKLHKYDYIIGIADDDYISDNFLFRCSKLIKFDPDIISVDSAYSYGGIVTYEPNTYSKNFFSNLQADDINFLKLKVSIVVKTDFYIRNDFYKIQNGEVCEVPYHKYYRFATFGYANGAKYIFESHAGNRRKYTNIFNWIIAIASLCMKNAIYNNIFNKNDFIRFWNQIFEDKSQFLTGLTNYSSKDVLDKILIDFKDTDNFMQNAKKVANEFALEFQPSFDETYHKLNSKLYTYEERNDIIKNSKTFMIYCQNEWGKQIKEQFIKQGLECLGFIDDANSMSCAEFLKSGLEPDFVFIATGKPKLMSDLINNLQPYKGKVLTLYEKDDSL